MAVAVACAESFVPEKASFSGPSLLGFAKTKRHTHDTFCVVDSAVLLLRFKYHKQILRGVG